jgi:hypothetical protein
LDIYYSGYIQTHCQKSKKIKWADQILHEVYGTTLNGFSLNSLKMFNQDSNHYFIQIHK